MEIVQTVVAALNDVITALRNEVQALGEGERNARRRLYWLLGSVLLLSGLSLCGLFINYHQAKDTKKVVSYIEDCQNPDGECSKENAKKLGEAVKTIGKLIFDSNSCVLRVPITERTDAVFAECRERYFGK